MPVVELYSVALCRTYPRSISGSLFAETLAQATSVTRTTAIHFMSDWTRLDLKTVEVVVAVLLGQYPTAKQTDQVEEIYRPYGCCVSDN